jgi:ribonuclease P protein component
VVPKFRRNQRLLTAADYRRVFTVPEFKSGQRELLLLACRSDMPWNRLGLAVAKKHVPTAVGRNLIKRLIREHFRVLPETQPTLDIVVITRPGARSATSAHIHQALEQHFERLARLAAKSVPLS